MQLLQNLVLKKFGSNEKVSEHILLLDICNKPNLPTILLTLKDFGICFLPLQCVSVLWNCSSTFRRFRDSQRTNSDIILEFSAGFKNLNNWTFGWMVQPNMYVVSKSKLSKRIGSYVWTAHKTPFNISFIQKIVIKKKNS